MSSWKQFVLTLLICSLCCGILSQVISGTGKQKLMRLICGIVLAVTIIAPVKGFNPEDLLRLFDDDWGKADYYISEGQKAAAEEQKRRIEDYCESYILDKAEALGMDVTAEISLDEMLVPVFAEISCGEDLKMQLELQKILTDEFGIPKENQKWIMNQDINSS